MASRALPLLVASTLVLVAFAGCMSSDPAPAPAAITGDGEPTEPAKAPAASKPVTPKPPAAPRPAPKPPVVTNFTYNGTTAAGACVDGPEGRVCELPVAGSAIPDITGPGNPLYLVATLAWENQTALTENLAVRLAVKTNDTWQAIDLPGWTYSGASPLMVGWYLGGYENGTVFGLLVEASATPDPASATPPAPVPVPPAPAPPAPPAPVPVPGMPSVSLVQEFAVNAQFVSREVAATA